MHEQSVPVNRHMPACPPATSASSPAGGGAADSTDSAARHRSVAGLCSTAPGRPAPYLRKTVCLSPNLTYPQPLVPLAGTHS
ncbi:hypothetical protein MILUP08_45732 [Micromonospora lupini str. Lupac 08]|uniref:Uncharacterized protein n=1 Tax=Micromonospora lupini str. Lupac 08 TaxID=1150864 RepID=I0LAJ2_9ACTN|nr:hypothetical protein MILUP08_45732 [Micromonospora lupini str. Lupac 08]